MPHAGEFERAFLTLAAVAIKRRIEGRMPIALHSFIKEPDSDRVLVAHTFYGKNEAEAKKFKQHHLASCEYYRAAEKDGRTIDLEEEIDTLPEFDLEELERFLEFEDEDEEDEELEEEEDEEEDEEEEE